MSLKNFLTCGLKVSLVTGNAPRWFVKVVFHPNNTRKCCESRKNKPGTRSTKRGWSLHGSWKQSKYFWLQNKTSVCSFWTAKLLFQNTNMVWKIGLVWKATSFFSHQTKWHNERISIKCYSIPQNFSWIKSYSKLTEQFEITSYAFKPFNETSC